MKKFVMISSILFLTACAKHAEDVTVTANDGKDGLAGLNGAPGPQGPAGVQGPIGLSGAAGAKGDVGPKGSPGVAGAKGDTGPAGKNGASCTVVQLSNGLKVTCTDGTTATVASSCTKGDKGDPGPAGPPGKNGKDGVCKECSDDFKPCGRDFDGEYRIRRDLYGKLYLVDLDGNVIQKLGIGTYHIRSRSCSKTCKIVIDCNDRVEDERGNSCSR